MLYCWPEFYINCTQIFVFFFFYSHSFIQRPWSVPIVPIVGTWAKKKFKNWRQSAVKQIRASCVADLRLEPVWAPWNLSSSSRHMCKWLRHQQLSSQAVDERTCSETKQLIQNGSHALPMMRRSSWSQAATMLCNTHTNAHSFLATDLPTLSHSHHPIHTHTHVSESRPFCACMPYIRVSIMCVCSSPVYECV